MTQYAIYATALLITKPPEEKLISFSFSWRVAAATSANNKGLKKEKENEKDQHKNLLFLPPFGS